MKKYRIFLFAILIVAFTACSKTQKKDYFDIIIGDKKINIQMNKTELSKIYKSYENDSGVVYFFLDSKDRDNSFNATFYPDGKIKTLYSMSETDPVIRFFKNIHLGMSREELSNAISMKPKKNNTDLCLIKFSKDEMKKINYFNQNNKSDAKQYVSLRKKKGTYLEIFIDEGVVAAVRVIRNM